MSDETTPTPVTAPGERSVIFDDRMRGILAGLFVGGFYWFLWLVHPHLTDTQQTMVIQTMLTLLGVVVGYYWGSSSGSKLKTIQKEIP